MITRRKALLSSMATAGLLSASSGVLAATAPSNVITTVGPVIGLRQDGISVFKGVR